MNTLGTDSIGTQMPPEARSKDAVYLSVVVPIYNEVENIPELHRQLLTNLQTLGRDFEVIYIDDGSRDGSFKALAEATCREPNARVIQFRRNFGQTAAISAGIAQSRGTVVMMMDGDLQNDPADIPRFIEQLESGHDVVSGWRKDRHDAFLSRRVPSSIANWLISRVTGVPLHDYGCTLKAYRREVISEIQLYGEMHRFIPAFASHVGASVTEIPVNHRPRIHGTSKYGISRTGRVLLDLMVVKFLGSYATKPIYVFGGLGILSMLASLVTLAILTWGKLFQGWYFIQSPLLLLTGVLLVIGVQLLLMGLLAELLMRTYHETRRKPIYHIRQTLNFADGEGES
jgi:glycosyltransferase involved in cell wall biosynthesis